MADNIEKIACFKEAIDREAQAEIDELLSGARAKSGEIVSRADDEFLEECYSLVSTGTKKIKERMTRLVSQKSFEAGREVIAHRNKIVEDFFEQLRAEIAAFTKTPEYEKMLAKQLSAIKAERDFTAETTAFVRSEDVAAVKKLYPALAVEADKKIKLGGVNVFYPKDGIYIDKTLDIAYAQQKESFVNNAEMQL